MIVTKPDYQPLPTGMQPAIVACIIDMGLFRGYREGDAPRRRVCIVWELAARKGNGERFTATEEYTATLSEGSNFRTMLEEWAGRPLTEEEERGFDTDRLIGRACTLELIKVPRASGPGLFTKIAKVHRAMKGINAWELETSPQYIPEWVARRMNEALPYIPDPEETAPEFVAEGPF